MMIFINILTFWTVRWKKLSRSASTSNFQELSIFQRHLIWQSKKKSYLEEKKDHLLWGGEDIYYRWTSSFTDFYKILHSKVITIIHSKTSNSHTTYISKLHNLSQSLISRYTTLLYLISVIIFRLHSNSHLSDLN